MEKHYNLRQASEILGVRVRTLRQWIRDGKLKATKYSCSTGVKAQWFISEEEMKRITNADKD